MIIKSPFKGWVKPLSESSDAAFAQELMGKGVAIEPLDNELYAPCDGVVINVAPTGHSVILKTQSDDEILIHIGIDTVGLKGAGFKAHVTLGDKVKIGDKLITFDMDFVGENVPSLLTPIIVMDPQADLKILKMNCQIAVGDALFEIGKVDNNKKKFGDKGVDVNIDGAIARQTLALSLVHGIHARPAGSIAQLARKFASEITINANQKTARANSIVALISLNAKPGDEIEIIAKGNDAETALSSMIELITSGIKEDSEELKPPSKQTNPKSQNQNYLYGVSASSGYAIAEAYIFGETEGSFDENGKGYKQERVNLTNAINAVINNLEANAKSFKGPAKTIALAHIEILQDPEINDVADKLLQDGLSAPAAWRKSSRQQEDVFKASESPRVRERASDLRDLERQIINAICGTSASNNKIPDDKEIILIADDLLPSQFLGLNHKNIKAICTKFGGPTAHVGILSASFGIPMIVAIGDKLSNIENAQLIIANADEGFLIPKPTNEDINAAHKIIDANQSKAELEAKNAKIDCVMADGTRIEVFANLASTEEASKAVENGAEGCGLLRTEFLFMERDTAPSEDEQIEALSAIAKSLDGRPLIVRTLDIGGDKPISYLPFPKEENPALGMRGIRYQLENLDIFKTQIRAIIKSVPQAQCRIMLPMIIDVLEFRAARKIIDEVALECGVKSKISVGVMVETPSAALMAGNLANEADFLSVGSNDLTQYTLAIDRGNPQLASRADSLHPAVLNLIAIAAQGAKTNNKWIGVCGGVASIPLAIPILIGLGITELSVPIAMIRQIKTRVRELQMQECVAIAQLALKATTADEVRQVLANGNLGEVGHETI